MASERVCDPRNSRPDSELPPSSVSARSKPPSAQERTTRSPRRSSFAEKLLSALEHPLPDVRERAAVFLGSVGGPEVRETLLSLAQGAADPYLAEAALRGLRAHERAWPALPAVDWMSFTRPGHSVVVRLRAMDFLNEDRRSATE